MPRLHIPYLAREVAGENDSDRWARILREQDRIPALNYVSAREDMREAGIR